MPRAVWDGFVSLVTGANRGIGREVCRQLATRGYTVVLGSRDVTTGEAAIQELDLTERAHQAHPPGRMVVRALDVKNAGAHYDAGAHAADADWRVIREALDTNLLGAWRTAAIFAPLLRASPSGRLVNVSSEAGSLAGMGRGGAPAYGVSKAALNALTRQLAADLRDARVLVNAVYPGWVATDIGGAGGRPVSDGAASVVWAVTLPDDGPTGGFFRDGRLLPW